MGIDPQRVALPHLHAVAAGWLDEGLDVAGISGHGQDVKPWCALPMADIDGVAVLGLTTLTEPATDFVNELELYGSPITLGDQTGRAIGDPGIVEAHTFASVRGAVPTPAHVVHFTTPTTFRSGQRSSPMPDPFTMIRSLSLRWNRLYPNNPITVDTRDIRSIWVSDLDGRNIVTTVKQATVSGFVGRIRLVADTPAAAAILTTLLNFARYAGVGSFTARGFGRIELEETWQ
ncbi:CRISPR system precrRNA processing endoribonuclease RAMP protein Cas6 [Millisia brevis]|uniref:CRISPR system precrRNA processing endoribonuclease RAMP protein Cas6 n=1 Tax=Millisia brevis TaxID=264148 RepID=UPI0008301910|nr:CRISPR system precrRNA processing endoribonuclease RAMP protein Cas6 [Millisia brevis]